MTEGGSLLEQALKREDALENALIVDVFLRPVSSSIDHLLALAKQAVLLNHHVRASSVKYPWMMGGDGPVFGVHTTDASPHLRAICRYGVSVADEWNLMGIMLDYTTTNKNLTVSCWDKDDGQVILVQSAHELPEWVERMGPEQCRHRCWMMRGSIHLILPHPKESAPELTLHDALQLIASNHNSVQSNARITAVIRETVRRVQSATHLHRAAVALPRSVATLLHHRPDLVAVACHAFCNFAQEHPLPQHDDYAPLVGTCHDWTMTTQSLGRTQYAMLRTLLAPPHWKTEDSIPAPYWDSIEVKRLQRISQATPHLQAAVQVGVRLVAGLDYLLLNMQEAKNTMPSSLEKRLVYWTRIDRECGRQGDWLQDAWSVGPNHSVHSLDYIGKCPVYQEELHDSLTPLSHPDVSVADQIRSELRRKDQLEVELSLPGPGDVDSEDWMVLPDEDELRKVTDPVAAVSNHHGETQALDNMLDGIQTFIKGTSDVEGVASNRVPSTDIDPTVFLNILHMTLKAQSVEEMRLPTHEPDDDPYFSKEDYDLGEDEEGTDKEMMNVMEAMDAELHNKTNERDGEGAPEDEAIALNMHVLGNLLKSLDADGGGSGPVQNILKELGVTTNLELSSDDERYK